MSIGGDDDSPQYVEPHPETIVTTTTPHGRPIDWIPIESQVSDGDIANPPPANATPNRKDRLPEREDLGTERGPEGTVPIVRDLVSHRRRVEVVGAEKVNPRRLPSKRPKRGPHPPAPNLNNYYHCQVEQTGRYFGSSAEMTEYQPTTQNVDDHSIMQYWLQADAVKVGPTRHATVVPQTVEAGWTVDRSLNGDNAPHFFTYFTTNNYSRDGDNLGGYNTTHKGWVQVSQGAYPGASLAPASHINSNVWTAEIRFMLYHNNWWCKFDNDWIGYYPGSLFSRDTSANPLSNAATWLAFGGEVYSDNANPNTTTVEMGSGRYAWHGSDGYAAWMRYVKATTSVDEQHGYDDDFGGAARVAGFGQSNPPLPGTIYTIDPHMRSGLNWGSFFFVGGHTS